MANQINWNPVYIRTDLSDKPKQRIDSDYWNALWNSVIDQGDNNTQGVLLLKTEVEVLIEQFAEVLDTATGIVAVATQQANLAQGHQVKAEDAAYDSENSAILSKSWAIGGTGERVDEDTDNAKYYSEQIAATAEDVAEQKAIFDDTASKALGDLTQIVEDAEKSLDDAISAQTTVFEGFVADTTFIKDEAVEAKSSAKASEDAAKNAEANAKAAQAAAEKARDEAQTAAGGDFVTPEEFEEGVKDFVTNSDMVAYVDSVMKVDENVEV